MPVFNERNTAETAIQRVLETDLPVDDWELLVVDDGSTDGTRELLTQTAWPARVRILAHRRNQGKGAALVTALREARGTWTTIMDADLEYDPDDIRQLLLPLTSGEAQAVFGKRGFKSHSSYSLWYVIGNKAVTLVANALYNSWISDLMTCHKAMSTTLFRSLELGERGFGIEAEIAARLLRRDIQIHEVPISYHARSREEGKKLTASDAVAVLRTLLQCRLKREGR